MTSNPAPPESQHLPHARPHADRSVPLLIGAAVLVVAVVAAVLLFGVQRPPRLATLADQPDPAVTGEVALIEWSGDRPCLQIGQRDGVVRELACDQVEGELVAWTDDGLLLERWDGRIATIDPTTGTTGTSASGAGHAAGTESDRSSITFVERDGDQLVVVLETDGVELWRTDAPPAYDVHGSARSPDGAWVALVDSAQRLLVVPADGSAPPRVWATGVDGWQPPVWEGQSRPA